jgi:sec-independent protein translocase protein TatA
VLQVYFKVRVVLSTLDDCIITNYLKYLVNEGGCVMGSTELIVILAIAVLMFGASAIPKLAKSIGEARREFNNALNEDEKNDTK